VTLGYVDDKTKANGNIIGNSKEVKQIGLWSQFKY